jgi:hypothetical protein
MDEQVPADPCCFEAATQLQSSNQAGPGPITRVKQSLHAKRLDSGWLSGRICMLLICCRLLTRL